MKSIKEEVEQILNTTDLDAPPSKLNDVKNLCKKIASLETELRGLKVQLRHASEDLNVLLISNIKKKNPKLSVGLNGSNCVINYCSRNLSCRPDHSTMKWHFEPNDWGRKFCKEYESLLNLNDNTDDLSSAIVKFFHDRFRSLENHEDI